MRDEAECAASAEPLRPLLSIRDTSSITLAPSWGDGGWVSVIVVLGEERERDEEGVRLSSL